MASQSTCKDNWNNRRLIVPVNLQLQGDEPVPTGTSFTVDSCRKVLDAVSAWMSSAIDPVKVVVLLENISGSGGRGCFPRLRVRVCPWSSGGRGYFPGFKVMLCLWLSFTVRLVEAVHEESALQVAHFLQRVYGFVIRDFSYEGMQGYREVKRSAVVLAVSFVRSAGFASYVTTSGTSDPGNEIPQWQTLNQLIFSV